MVIACLGELLHESAGLGIEIGRKVLLHAIRYGLVSMISYLGNILNTVWANASNTSWVDAVGPIIKVVDGPKQMQIAI